MDPAGADEEARARGRRGGADRRARPTPMLSRYLFFRGHRRGGRREGERENVYVDRHGAWTYLAFAVLLALSLVDAGYTLHELEHGATEANPIMRAALELGNVAFVVIKTAATILGGLVLILHKTWRMGRYCLALALGAYIALMAYHVVGGSQLGAPTTSGSEARPASGSGGAGTPARAR